MNRRRFLIALAVLVPLAIFSVAKWATRWRPVALGATTGMSAGDGAPVAAGQNAVVLQAPSQRQTLRLDLQTGQMRALGTRGICQDGRAWWQLGPRHNAKDNPPLLITHDGQTRAYPLPREVSQRLPIYTAGARVYRTETRIDLVYEDHYCRWDVATGRLERHLKCEMDFETAWAALTRDGTTLVDASDAPIALLSTRTGRVIKRVIVAGTRFGGAVTTSNFGSYVVSTARKVSNGDPLRWEIINPRKGRVLWNCPRVSEDDFVVLAPDETRIAVAQADKHSWKIYDLATGQLVRTLPLARGATTGAFSPDGATLYSVANGVLYRQRAL